MVGWLCQQRLTGINLRDHPASVDIYFAEKMIIPINPLFYKACRAKII
jgi:hypothetical protein